MPIVLQKHVPFEVDSHAAVRNAVFGHVVRGFLCFVAPVGHAYTSTRGGNHGNVVVHVAKRHAYAKDELLAYIDDFIAQGNEEELRGYREKVTRSFR